jgi:sugar-specific transcriptional regulator TrmB
VKDPLIETLQELRFTEYEAKTYLALLAKSPLSAYAVARLSGVPRSKIYEVLEGMVGRGEVLVSYGTPTQYAPLRPEELIALRKREADAVIQAAENGLKRYAAAAANRDLIWDIAGRDEIVERARDVIGRARWRILLEIWEEDAPSLHDALAAAAARGLEVLVVGYGVPDYPFAHVYQHDMTSDFKGRGGRWIVLSADQREIVAGIISLGSDSRAAWSSHPGLVAPITEEIKHDLYIMEILARHREILEASFGPGLVRLRDQFGPTTILTQVEHVLGTRAVPSPPHA